MIRRAAGYMRALLKRAAVLLPYVLLICLLMLAGVSVFTVANKENRENDESKELVSIGVVADYENRYMKIAMNAIENFDYSRESLKFIRLSEEEAKKGLAEGRFGGYLIIPDDFFDKISVGEHSPMTYVSAKDESALGMALAEEVIRAISGVLRTCEVSINGIMEYIGDEKLDADDVDTANELISAYFSKAVRREFMFRIEEVGVLNGQSFEKYLFCALLVFFLMLWGICMVPLYAGRKVPMMKIMASSGVGAYTQTALEYIVHLVLMIAGAALILPSALLSLHLFDHDLLALMLPSSKELPAFFFRVFLLIVPFSAISYLFYEVSSKIVGSLLLQTLYVILTGYICGCFYPSYFFSPVVQKIGSFLPAGVALNVLAQPTARDAALLCLWGALCVIAAMLLRKKRLAGDLS